MVLLSNVFRPVVTDPAGVRRYVVSVTLLAWIITFVVDSIRESFVFTTWLGVLRDDVISALIVIVIAVPIARTMGRAHMELHHAKREADRLGRIDPLTGLANRRAFYEAAERLGDGDLALVIADIDRFKRVNDHYGHAAGDAIIKAVAQRMQRDLGDLGMVARLGGEEFALISANLPAGELRARLQRFRQRVADEPVEYALQTIHATISVGFAARREFDFDAQYAAADKALYAAKNAGRDCVVDYNQLGPEAAEPLPLAG